jgi:putative MATE family efflux protein
MKKELDLGKEKIGKLLVSFSIPCIISMLINAVYNIVDQIFIGQGVGYLGNAATNVIFPLVIICNAIAGLIGNGCAAGLSLKLGEGKKEEARKSVGSSISFAIIASIIFGVIAYIFLPQLVNLFGCTETVYPYALEYGKIIAIGAPFMIMYTAIASIIRADGSPKYSMVCLLVGAIINIIFDPIFIFGFNMGVRGGALATIIGQIVSAVIALAYIPRIKSVDLKKEDFKIDSSILKVLGYGTSSCITQLTILVLFVYMNNIMTKLGAASKFGDDIPLSVYGVISKVNNIYVSSVLGVAIGSQPIIGFNYGAGKYDRVKETLKKVLKINFIIGIVFNVIMLVFPTQIVSIFGSADDELYLEFATDFCRIFLAVCALNAFEMTASTLIQSLGNAKKATFVTFTRQIILFIPISFTLTRFLGLYGALYGAPISDIACFIAVIFIFGSEYRKIGKKMQEKSHNLVDDTSTNNILKQKVIITISREFGSGGRYIGRIIADKLGIKFYDKDLVTLVSKEAGLAEEFIEEHEQKREWGSSLNSAYNTDDKLFEAETRVIKEIAQKESCVIIGRCADYILKDEKNILKVFIYSDKDDKVNRAVKYYEMNEKNAAKEIEKVNKNRAKHYKYYTNQVWGEKENYDFAMNSDLLGVDKTAELISQIVIDKYNK